MSFIVLACAVTLAGCSDGNNNNNNSNSTLNIAETAIEAGDFQTLVTALQAAGLVEVLSDEDQTFTVFAPTDAAFELLGEETINALLADTDTLADILLYHVIAGQAVDAAAALALANALVETANGDSIALNVRDGELFINNARVPMVDIEASNGVIHVLDAVLIPPADTEPAGNIVEVAQANGNFVTLIAALQAAGLEMTLADPEATLTVFAPTDAAFDALGQDTINALLGDIPTMTDILLYHVVAGSAVDSLTALTLVGTEVEMANGDNATIELDGNDLWIAGVKIAVTDIPATNGIIHVLDAVLTPPEG